MDNDKKILQKVLTSSLNGLYIYDLEEGANTFINPAYTRITGYTLQDLRSVKGPRFFALFHPEDQVRVAAHMESIRHAADNDIHEIEYRFKTANNGWIWCLSRDTVFERSDDGTVRQMLGTFLDITGRKRMEDALRESERRYRELVDNANSSILRWKKDGTITFFNEYALELFGYSADEVVGKHVNMIVPDKETTGGDLSQLAQEIVDHPENYISNINENICRDGSRIWMAWTNRPLFDNQGMVSEILAVGMDVTERKQVEKALRESEERLRLFIDHAPASLAMLDREMRYLSVSRRWRSDYKLGNRDLIGVSHYEVFPEIPEHWRAVHRRALAGEIVQAESDRFQRADGSVQWLRWEVRPWRDHAGDIAGIVIFSEDITERKRTEEAMRESEERFRLLFEQAVDGIAVLDAKGRVLDINTACCEMLGYGREEILGRKFADTIAPEEVPRIASEMPRLACGEVTRSEWHFRRKDGSVFVGEVVGRQLPDGRLQGILRDITERKRADVALMKSEEKFKLLSQVAGELLASADPQGLVNHLCRKVMEHLDCHAFFNYILDERVGRLRLNAYAGIPDEEAQKIEWLDLGVAVCGCVAQEGRRLVVEDIFRGSDIRTALVKSYGIQAYACHPLIIQEMTIGTISFGTKSKTRFSSEELVLMKTVADQVATAMERIRLLEELRRSRDELESRVQARTADLESRNRELQDFASIASHDLQEPLRKVQMFGDLLRNRYESALGDEGKDWVFRMTSASKRMQTLLNALLNYARVTIQAKPFVEISLNNVVQDVLTDLEARLQETGGNVKVEKLPTIEADPSQMNQLFQNLIGNALKFHKESEKPLVKVSSQPGNGVCRISVRDNGIGFDEQHLIKIFAPFQRLHGKTGSYEGTGMGLAICKKIVERHGGTITARSTPGKGSVFIINLPVKQDRSE
jgi:PAS domain S-box-containing protein